MKTFVSVLIKKESTEFVKDFRKEMNENHSIILTPSEKSPAKNDTNACTIKQISNWFFLTGKGRKGKRFNWTSGGFFSSRVDSFLHMGSLF